MFHLMMNLIYVFKIGYIGTEWRFVEYLIILTNNDNHIIDITNKYLNSNTELLTNELNNFLGGYHNE